MNGLKEILLRKNGLIENVLYRSLLAADREQGLGELKRKLQEIVPDISDQYSQFKVEGRYLECSVRNVHAFQISLVMDVIAEFDSPVVVDIGDSSGTHLRYIKSLNIQKKDIRALSVNLDEAAVERIKAKKMEAIHARAEDLSAYNVNADIFVCFETLEHLSNPCQFLHDLSTKTQAKYFIATVPFVRQSRAGLLHIRRSQKKPVFAENTHIFEFSPADWSLIAQHSGWRVLKEKVYFQYPRKGFWRITQPIWKKMDFEGFYGMILVKDDVWSSLYKDW